MKGLVSKGTVLGDAPVRGSGKKKQILFNQLNC